MVFEYMNRSLLIRIKMKKFTLLFLRNMDSDLTINKQLVFIDI